MSRQINLKDIPQANSLEKVLLSVIAVNSGANSSQDIADVIGMSDRQGRYYRRAAEIFGFIERDERNNSVITSLGKSLLGEINYDPKNTIVLKDHILRIPVIEDILDAFSDEERITESAIISKLEEYTEDGEATTTTKRRNSTIVRWMTEVGIASKGDEGSIEINRKYIKPQTPQLRIISSYSDFVSDLNLHIEVPFESNISNDDKETLDVILENDDRLASIISSESGARLARMILFVSEKTKIDIERLRKEITFFKSTDLSHGRLLVEVERSLRGLSATIAKGGSALEVLLKNYLMANRLKFHEHHLFSGLTKNVDFYVPSLQLAIECKYTNAPGTKHAGALMDLREQSKGKKEHFYKLGILAAGKQYTEDSSFGNSILALKDEGILDYIFTPEDLKLNPKKLLDVSRNQFKEAEMSIDLEHSTTWFSDLDEGERGIDDAVRWLQRFLNVKHLGFVSLLNTWVSQTPFALEVFRLVLGWSNSKMSTFVKSCFEQVVDWREKIENFEMLSTLVKVLNDELSDSEKQQVMQFFEAPVTHLNFLMARELALRGVAIKRKDTSKYFIGNCLVQSRHKVIDGADTSSQALPSGASLAPNFVVQKDGKEKFVLCKYYASSGSKMSDLVKSISELAETGKASDWVFIVDGPGWLERKKDLNRLISLVHDRGIELYTLSSWSGLKKASGT